MPTGYTADVQDGNITELKDYALLCARAFGPLIHMRDDSLDTPISEPDEESWYNTEALKKAKDALYDMYNSTNEDLQSLLEEEYSNQEKSRLNQLEKIRVHRNHYENMLSKVHNWEPPTKDHVELKKFMINQLNESVNFDCNDEEYYDNPSEEMNLSDWFDENQENYLWRIDYHEKRIEERSEKTEDKKIWIKNLKESFS